MASLTITAYYARNAIKFGGIALAVMMIGRFVLVNAYNVYLILNPPDDAPPTYGYGILPDLEYPESDLGEITYKLETPTGGFPAFTDRAAVFEVINERPNLLALETATEEMEQLGFSNTPEQVSETVFRWRKGNPVATTLDMKIFTGTFEMKVDWASKVEFITEKQLPSEIKAVDIVQNTLGTAKLLPTDLEEAERKVSFLKASGKQLKSTISLSEADFIQVDLYRAAIAEEYSVLTPEPARGVVRAIVSGNPRLASVIYLEYNYFPIDYEQFETYPIITPTTAWTKLQQGEGFVARLDSGIDGVVVRRVGLGYYDSYDPQPYLQPIYVFTGDNNFVAYVSAVAEEEQ